MMSQFCQNIVDTDLWNLSGHCPSSLQQTWGESTGFTALDWNRRIWHFLDREQSTSGHCPSQGYSFYPTEASPGHIPCGFASTQLATAIEAFSPCYQQIYNGISSGEAQSKWTFQSGQGTQMAQPDVYHNTQFSPSQQSSPCNIHFQHGLQQNTYQSNVQNLNSKDENYDSTQLPKYLSFDPSESKWSDYYRKFEQYADDKHWSSQECKSNLKYVLHRKAADYMAYLNELVPDLTYYDFIMQIKRYMASQDLYDSQFKQWHGQRIQTARSHLSLIRMIALKPWTYSPNHHFRNAIGKVKNSLLATEVTHITVIYHLIFQGVMQWCMAHSRK